MLVKYEANYEDLCITHTSEPKTLKILVAGILVHTYDALNYSFQQLFFFITIHSN